jgi:hypothetical protein
MATATKAKPKGSTATRRRKATPKRATKRWRSRAVLRRIEAGSSVSCVRCEDHIKFSAKDRANQVICNVYRKGVWDRVEHYHEACYLDADSPYGQAED